VTEKEDRLKYFSYELSNPLFVENKKYGWPSLAREYATGVMRRQSSLHTFGSAGAPMLHNPDQNIHLLICLLLDAHFQFKATDFGFFLTHSKFPRLSQYLNPT
jgi:hypothetical protein